MDTGDLVEEMLAAPAALAYLSIAEASGLTPEQAAEPVAALFLCGAIEQLVGAFMSDRDQLVGQLEASVARLRPYAEALSAQPGLLSSWFASVRDRDQVWIEGRTGGPPSAGRLTPPAESAARHGRWEAYAQKSAGGLYTCSAVEGVHPVLRDGRRGSVGDYSVGELRPMWRLAVRPDARVCEVRGAGDWHALCARYPSPARETPGVDEGVEIVVPDWPAVAADWDGVHLTLGGFLLADQRTVERDGVRSRHWAWDVEQTLWLRWAFDDAEPFTCAAARGPGLRLPEWYADIFRDGAFTVSGWTGDGAPRPAG